MRPSLTTACRSWRAPLRDPFIAVRSYLPADHPLKHAEIGSEPDPATFLDTLLALTAEWGRVLAPWGSIAIELGDSFAGSGGSGGDYSDGGLRDGQNAFVGSSSLNRRTDTKRTKVADETAIGGGIRDLHGKVQGGGQGWPRPKCLALVPQLYAASLAYGRNLLTGEPSPAGQWLVRNVIVWHRPNPAVGALGDKYRPSTSYITVATRSPKRWFDLTAVRQPHKGNHKDGEPIGSNKAGTNGQNGFGRDVKVRIMDPAGAPPLDTWFDEHDHHDTWTLTTQPSKLSHYAMWPAKLAERLILSMCPAEVCTVCGEPRRRVEGKAEYVGQNGARPDGIVSTFGRSVAGQTDGTNSNLTRIAPTLGWTDCGCGAKFIPGTVLDPFCGTFTTGCVAEFHGRSAIGIDIDERNHHLWPQRRTEVFRALNPTHITPITGQQELW